jgi:hypothetical protein
VIRLFEYYHANGFCIYSDTELLGWQKKALYQHEYRMILYENMFSYEESIEQRPFIYNNDGIFYFSWNGQLVFRTLLGKKTIEYYVIDNSCRIDITFALNYILGFVAPQIGMLAFHGCSIKSKSGLAFIILGESGIGKSTLMRDFLDSGFSYISEEITFVQKQKSHFWVETSNTILRMATERYCFTRGDIIWDERDNKTSYWNSQYSIALSPTCLSKVIIIERSADKTISLTKIPKTELIDLLLSHHLYVKSVISWLPFHLIVRLISEFISSTDFYAYNVELYPDSDIIMRLISESN